MEDWLSNSFPLCPVLVEEDCLIEDCDTLTLQVYVEDIQCMYL